MDINQFADDISTFGKDAPDTTDALRTILDDLNEEAVEAVLTGIEALIRLYDEITDAEIVSFRADEDEPD